VRTHAEFDLDTLAEMDVVAYIDELRIEFGKGGSSVILNLSEDLVKQLSAILPVALEELSNVRDNALYEHRVVVIPSS
jgi:hypothetical protein